MKAEDYTPEDSVKFTEMLKDAREVKEPAHLSSFSMCWILDQSYPRKDICAVLNIVENEKGWKNL